MQADRQTSVLHHRGSGIVTDYNDYSKASHRQ